MAEVSFFTMMKGRLLEEGRANQEGRYLGICLTEVLRENKSLRVALLPGAPSLGRAKVVKEFRYLKTQIEDRQADLALLGIDDHPLALVEVKMEDGWLPGQPESYRRYCKREGCKLLVISRWPVAPDIQSKLGGDDCRTMSVNDLYREVMKHDGAQFPVTKLFAKFLEENEMLYQRFIDDGLCLLLSRMFLGSDINYKLNEADLIDNIPDSLRSIFTTLKTVGAAVRDRVELPRNSSKKWMNVTVNMRFWPHIKLEKLESLVEAARSQKLNGDAEIGVLEYDDQRGGQAEFLASLQIADGTDQTYLCFSLTVDIKKGQAGAMKLWTWVSPDNEDGNSHVEARPKVILRSSLGAWDLGGEAEFISDVVKGLKASRRQYLKAFEGLDKKERWKQRKYVRRVPLLRATEIR